MPQSPEPKGNGQARVETRRPDKLGLVSGVYVPVFLNILSILMFLRFGLIIGQVGLVGILGLLVTAYLVDLLTALSLSAIASNGEVKGGGAYYLISRSLGPEFGGSIGILFYLAQALNTAMNIAGLIDCIRLNVGTDFPQGYWIVYGLQSAALAVCTGLCLLGSSMFSKASNALLVILSVAIVSIPVSAIFKPPFQDASAGVEFTGVSLRTLKSNLLPHTQHSDFRGVVTFRALFGILFPATSGIFAGASMSGDLRNPSKDIPKGTLWAMLTTFIVYLTVALSMAASTTHDSFLANENILSVTNLSSVIILAGECAVSIFSALMGILGSSKLFQALAKDKLLPGLSIFGYGTKVKDEPILAMFLTYSIAQVALLADLNEIATFISMGFQMTFFVMNLACFLLKIGAAPNFRPSFQFFTWQTAFVGSLLSATAMFFIDETYAAMAICAFIGVFLLIHYLCPPKRWGDVSQNLIYHQVRKYLLRLKPEHIKFWRPHIILLINDPRRQARLIQFCNSLKKGSLYILGHVIVTDDFNSGVHEAKLQQQAWSNYISEFSRIKAFVQLNMSPSITWGIRNLILSAGLGGMRPNIAVLGFYNMEDLRKSNPYLHVPDIPMSPSAKMSRPPKPETQSLKQRRRRDTSARLLEGALPTDVIRRENMMSATDYMTILEDLALQYRLNVGIAHGFDKLETPRRDGTNSKRYVDLWPIQMSAEVNTEGRNLVTTNFDTYTLILQLGHILNSVHNWRRVYSIRVMVFVEYESEVEEERARVKALLEKLRIEAEVLVFWLASGKLDTYELIINGVNSDIDNEIVVNEALKDEEWWEELQSYRRQTEQMSASREMTQVANILESTSGRPGVYNPHDASVPDRRRASMVDAAEIPRRPDIALLSRLGVSLGIHTHHLDDGVLDDSSSDTFTDSEAQSTVADDDLAWERSGEGETDSLLPSHPAREIPHQERTLVDHRGRKGQHHVDTFTAQTPSYGTLVQQVPQLADQLNPKARSGLPDTARLVNDVFESSAGPSAASAEQASGAVQASGTLNIPQFLPSIPRRSDSVSPTRRSGTKTPRSGAATPSRPTMSRQSSAVKFSSRPVPETRIAGEDSSISFAPQAPTVAPGSQRPLHSRHSSFGKPVSRTTTAMTAPSNGGEGSSRVISFAEQSKHQGASASHSRHHSRQASQYSTLDSGDVSLSIPELIDAYKAGSQDTDSREYPSSVNSTQSVALSFNDLPSRAQHLILNELMRQNSTSTAVLLSTLPVPSEGTCLDESSTIQYLSDIEILCHQLPPTLMVLSNNMTVTVSL